jgi:hypothetical protein
MDNLYVGCRELFCISFVDVKKCISIGQMDVKIIFASALLMQKSIGIGQMDVKNIFASASIDAKICRCECASRC